MTLLHLALRLLVAVIFLQTITPAHAAEAKTILRNAAAKHKVPYVVALKIATKETRVKCGVWGDGGKSGGLLQIYWPTANSKYAIESFDGFKKMSCEELTDMGMRHLSTCWRMAKGNLWKTAACHNAGWGVLNGKPVPSMAKTYANIVAKMVDLN